MEILTKRQIEYRRRIKYELWYKAKARAKKSKLPFNIVPEDIVIPKECPILGLKITSNKGNSSGNSPTVDRKYNKFGYTKDNIWVISSLANTMKAHSSSQQRVLFALWILKTHLKNVNLYKDQLIELLKEHYGFQLKNAEKTSLEEFYPVLQA